MAKLYVKDGDEGSAFALMVAKYLDAAHERIDVSDNDLNEDWFKKVSILKIK